MARERSQAWQEYTALLGRKQAAGLEIRESTPNLETFFKELNEELRIKLVKQALRDGSKPPIKKYRELAPRSGKTGDERRYKDKPLYKASFSYSQKYLKGEQGVWTLRLLPQHKIFHLVEIGHAIVYPKMLFETSKGLRTRKKPLGTKLPPEKLVTSGQRTQGRYFWVSAVDSTVHIQQRMIKESLMQGVRTKANKIKPPKVGKV